MKTFEKLLLVREMSKQQVVIDYFYFKENYKLFAIELSKQQALDVDRTAMQQIYFTENLGPKGNTTIFFILEKVKETVLDFSHGTMRVLLTYFDLI